MRSIRLLLAASACAAALVGCALDNGLPSDLRQHLSDKGVVIAALRSSAPLTSRSGYVEIKNEPVVVEAIIRALELAPAADTAARARCVQSTPDASDAVWLVGGRPTALRLKAGGQFEYLCVVVSTNARVFLVAEYAYG